MPSALIPSPQLPPPAPRSNPKITATARAPRAQSARPAEPPGSDFRSQLDQAASKPRAEADANRSAARARPDQAAGREASADGEPTDTSRRTGKSSGTDKPAKRSSASSPTKAADADEPSLAEGEAADRTNDATQAAGAVAGETAAALEPIVDADDLGPHGATHPDADGEPHNGAASVPADPMNLMQCVAAPVPADPTGTGATEAVEATQPAATMVVAADTQAGGRIEMPVPQPLGPAGPADGTTAGAEADGVGRTGMELPAGDALDEPAAVVTPTDPQPVAAQPGRPARVASPGGANPAGRLAVGGRDVVPDADVLGTDTAATDGSDAAVGDLAPPVGGFAEQFAAAYSPEPATVDGVPADDPVESNPATSGGGGVGPNLFDPSLLDQPARDAGVRPGDSPSPGIAPPAADPLTEDRFAAVNHARIAREVRGELMPNGGSMHLRLDPPELGALQVSVHLKDGVVTAEFQAQNEDAARLLSHTMGDLRASLQAQGVVVDKLHVQQAPREEAGGNDPGRDGGRQTPTFEQQQDARREQQRKDMVQRLWDKLNGVAPLDLVA